MGNTLKCSWEDGLGTSPTGEQFEEMTKRKKCEKCIHDAVCLELEEYRDPLGFISTENEWVCPYYEGHHKAPEVAELEAKLVDVTANWQKIHNSYDADCIEHYNKGRSDVAREIFKKIENDIDESLKCYFEERNKEVIIDTPLAEYLSGKIDGLSSVKFMLAELKKKYTEDVK